MTNLQRAEVLVDCLTRIMGELSEDDRVTVFDWLEIEFCRHCGSDLDGQCHCTNDDSPTSPE